MYDLSNLLPAPTFVMVAEPSACSQDTRASEPEYEYLIFEAVAPNIMNEELRQSVFDMADPNIPEIARLQRRGVLTRDGMAVAFAVTTGNVREYFKELCRVGLKINSFPNHPVKARFATEFTGSFIDV